MVYDNIKTLAAKKNMTIHAVEVKAGLSNNSIGKWKTCNPTVKNLVKVAKVLEVSVESLLKE